MGLTTYSVPRPSPPQVMNPRPSNCLNKHFVCCDE
jgi:hypothetical protein